MKQPLRYYNIGEVAEMLGENPSAIRYWSNTFPKQFKLQRNPKGNRRYTAEDIEKLKRIQYLINVEGLKLSGVAKTLAGDGRKTVEKVDRDVQVLESLREIRGQLLEVKKIL